MQLKPPFRCPARIFVWASVGRGSEKELVDVPPEIVSEEDLEEFGAECALNLVEAGWYPEDEETDDLQN